MRETLSYTIGLMLMTSVNCSSKWFDITSDFLSIPVYNGSKVDVHVQLELNQLIANALIMNVEMTYFMIQRWQDYRFIKNDSTDPHNKYVTLYGNDPDWAKIWIPDTYLINEIPSGLLDFVPTDSVRIYENGTVKMSRRHIATFYCKIRLYKIPMTSETCSLQFQSNSYSTDEMNMTWWRYDPIIYSPNFVSIVSKISDVETKSCYKNQEDKPPCLDANIAIDQIYKGYIIQVYLPSTAIVIMLWLGFWVSLKEVSSRVRVVSVAFVAQVTQMVGIMIVFPDTIQLEPLLVWNGFCLVMNVIAFVEFLLVHNLFIKRLIRKQQQMHDQEIIIEKPSSASRTAESTTNIEKMNSNLPNGQPIRKVNKVGMLHVKPFNEESLEETNSIRIVRDEPRSMWTPYRVDKLGLIIYTAIFLVFNVVYWTKYLS